MRNFSNASVSFTEGQYCLNVGLEENSAKKMKEYTANHVGDHLAIVIDEELIETPKIFDPLQSNGLLIGGLGEAKARELAGRINHQ